MERIFNLRLFSILLQTNEQTTNDFKRDYQRAKSQSLCLMCYTIFYSYRNKNIIYVLEITKKN